MGQNEIFVACIRVEHCSITVTTVCSQLLITTRRDRTGDLSPVTAATVIATQTVAGSGGCVSLYQTILFTWRGVLRRVPIRASTFVFDTTSILPKEKRRKCTALKSINLHDKTDQLDKMNPSRDRDLL